ncbi:MAG: hypothetical protein JSV56_04735 [Methanomassiliicoccales archaeon]|nr:MAG: hypothetical protein JSV56_04735 [Methanomassiliicoccales archaeon]
MGFLKYVLMAAGLFLLFLGLIYLLATIVTTGAGLIAVACILLFLSYKLEKQKASQPRLVSQNVQVGASGDVSIERFKCRGCGTALKEKDLRMVDGAVLISCPFCGSIYQLEEEPKW